MNRIKLGASLLTLGVVCGLVGPSFAYTTNNWTGAVSTDWTNTGNWSNGIVAVNWDWVNFNANTLTGKVIKVVDGGTGRISLESGLTKVIVLESTFGAARNALLQNAENGGSTQISIAADSQDLVLSSGLANYYFWWSNGNVVWDIGSGRTLYCNCPIFSIGNRRALNLTGLGTALFTRVSSSDFDINVNKGVAKTVIDNAASTSKWTVATGATWEFGAQSHRISGLSGGGTVKSPEGDTVFMGPVTRINGELISTNRNYKYKLDFGPGGGATVNGVVFDAATTSGTGWSLSGGVGPWGSDVGSGYSQLMYDFYYGPPLSTLTFSNLTVGTKYEAVIYASPVAWGTGRRQDATFSNGTSVVMLRVTSPEYTGYYVYRFTAQTEKASISMNAYDSGSYHWFGATLEDLASVATGSRAATLTLDVANTNRYDGVISGDIALVKQGSGTQLLLGTNTYSGATIISNGILYARVAVPIVNAGFESPNSGGFTYMSNFPGKDDDGVPGGWSSTTSNKVGFCQNTFCPTPLPEGSQGAFLQHPGHIEQVITVPESGTYELNFKLGRRPGGFTSGISVKIGGVTKATWSDTNLGTAWTNLSANIELTAGASTIRFETVQASGECNETIDDVRLYSPSGSLPTNTALSIVSGAALDLSFSSQTVRSLAGAGTITTAAGGTLTVTGTNSFTGTITGSGALNVTGVISPAGPGVIGTNTVTQARTFSGRLEVDVATDGSSDLLATQGTLNLTGATVSVVNPAGLNKYKQYVVLSYSVAPTGSFSDLNLPSGWKTKNDTVNKQILLLAKTGTMVSFF
jgi:autotransporter-associated beta strand protein